MNSELPLNSLFPSLPVQIENRLKLIAAPHFDAKHASNVRAIQLSDALSFASQQVGLMREAFEFKLQNCGSELETL